MPIDYHKISGRTIGALNVPYQLSGGGEAELIHLLPGNADTEGTVLHGLNSMQDWLPMPLNSLSPQERQVALLVANGLTWTEAARVMELPGTDARNIERKIKRTARQYVERHGMRAKTVSGMTV